MAQLWLNGQVKLPNDQEPEQYVTRMVTELLLTIMNNIDPTFDSNAIDIIIAPHATIENMRQEKLVTVDFGMKCRSQDCPQILERLNKIFTNPKSSAYFRSLGINIKSELVEPPS